MSAGSIAPPGLRPPGSLRSTINTRKTKYSALVFFVLAGLKVPMPEKMIALAAEGAGCGPQILRSSWLQMTLWWTKVICNQDDRKICGPQPAPSAANAIIFSGIGTFKPASTKNTKAEYFVFRVFIVDRSEPGGRKPGGAIEPADIYCFQAWDANVAVSNGDKDTSTIATALRARVAFANCQFMNDLASGAIPTGSLPSAGTTGSGRIGAGPTHHRWRPP